MWIVLWFPSQSEYGRGIYSQTLSESTIITHELWINNRSLLIDLGTLSQCGTFHILRVESWNASKDLGCWGLSMPSGIWAFATIIQYGFIACMGNQFDYLHQLVVLWCKGTYPNGPYQQGMHNDFPAGDYRCSMHARVYRCSWASSLRNQQVLSSEAHRKRRLTRFG